MGVRDDTRVQPPDVRQARVRPEDETWVDLHVQAFAHFDGVPCVIVPDNLKAAVIRAAFAIDDDPVIHRTYRELARHYGFRIDPTPPRSPEKKGKVESDVKYVKNNFLKTWESIDLATDNRELARWVEEIAGKRVHGTTGRVPIEVFHSEEHAALLRLPPARWETTIWKKARVHRDSHIQVTGAFYSAPWLFMHKEVWVRVTRHSITIYHEDQRLRDHARVARGQRSTVPEDLPHERRDLRHRTRSHWIALAQGIGDDVLRLVEAVFGTDDVLNRLRPVQAIVRHLQTFPPERACAAARRALYYGSLDYVSIKNILRKGLDLEPLGDAAAREWASQSRYARIPTSNRKDGSDVCHE